MTPNSTLTFHSRGLMTLGSRGLLAMMLHSVVVFMPASDDGCICTFYIVCLTHTWEGQKVGNYNRIYVYRRYSNISDGQMCLKIYKWLHMNICVCHMGHLLTIAAAASCTAHGVPCAALAVLAAGQTGSADVVAEFITSAVFIISAHTWLLNIDREALAACH